MLTYIRLLLKAFSQLFIIFDPWVFSALLAVVIWSVAKFLPNVTLKIVRSTSVFVYWIITLLKWKYCILKIVLILEYNFQANIMLLYFFRQENEECVHSILIGIIFCIWFLIGIYLLLHELIHWRVVKAV